MTDTTKPGKAEAAPPRGMKPGDVVAAFSELLGEWTAAQITNLDPEARLAEVLELDWSGPEPRSVADLGEVAPLSLTHHRWSGKVSQRKVDWVLPRSYKVVGRLPLLRDEPSNSYGAWPVTGLHLLLQRRWDQGHRDEWSDPHVMNCTGQDLDRLLEQSAAPDQDVRHLTVCGIESLDAAKLVARFPHLTALTLRGKPGTLLQAASLNELTALKNLVIEDLFGMTASDRLLPSRVTALDSLDLESVPADYAEATRSTWRPEVPMGTSLSVTKPREPDWVVENRDNPFRDWDGDDHIPLPAYKKAVALYAEMRAAVMAVLTGGMDREEQASRLFELGAAWGEAFNELDEQHEFIETVERERLFDVLAHAVAAAEASLGTELAWARDNLIDGTESVRDW